MNRALQLAGLALLSLGVFLAWPSTEVVHANPNLDPDAGKKVWDAKQCKNCHGANAEGKYGPPLAGLARNATTLEAVTTQVRTPFKNMPAWSTAQISDAELADLVDYLKTLTPNPDWKFAPYVAQPGDDPGKVLFNQKDCAACHGPNADRIITQVVKAQGKTTITAAEILKQVRTPFKNMPTFKDTTVTDADIATMAPFITAAVEKALSAAPASAATAAPTALPATLPKTGAQQASSLPQRGADGGEPSAGATEPQLRWALAAALAGLGLLGAGFVLRRGRTQM